MPAGTREAFRLMIGELCMSIAVFLGIPKRVLDELCMSVAIFGLPRVPDGLAYRRSGRGGVCEFVRSSIVIGSFCSIAIAITSIGSRGSSTSN